MDTSGRPWQARRACQPPLSTRAEQTADLLARASALDDELARRRLLDEVVVLNMGVADAVAGRYRFRGVPDDDLNQVAYLALVKAVRRYDPSLAGGDFLSYAVPTMRGEVRRYFRDHGWMVKPSRRIQELEARVAATIEDLTATLGRSPRPTEISAHLDTPVEHVNEALATDGCFRPASLDRLAGDGSATVGDLLGDVDPALAAVEARTTLGPAVRHLSRRDRRIIQLRYFDGWSQARIGSEIGVTQAQVSRLLDRIMAELRTDLGTIEAG